MEGRRERGGERDREGGERGWREGERVRETGRDGGKERKGGEEDRKLEGGGGRRGGERRGGTFITQYSSTVRTGMSMGPWALHYSHGYNEIHSGLVWTLSTYLSM